MKHLKITTFVFAVLLAGSLGACKKKTGDAAGGGVGVPECDDYLTRMDACAKKTGGKDGEQITKMADMMRKSWSEDAKKADMKAAMPGTCKSAIKDMAKQKPDCDWGVPAAPAGDMAGSAGSAAAGSGDMAGSAAAGSGDMAGSAAAGSGSAMAGSAGSGSAMAGSGSAK